MYIERVSTDVLGIDSPQPKLHEVFQGENNGPVVEVTTKARKIRRVERKTVTTTSPVNLADGRKESTVVEAFEIVDVGTVNPSRVVRVDGGPRFTGSNDDAFWANVRHWSDLSTKADKKAGVNEMFATVTGIAEIGSFFGFVGTSIVYGSSYLAENADRPAWALIGMGITAASTAILEVGRRGFRTRANSGARYRRNVQASRATIGKSQIESKR